MDVRQVAGGFVVKATFPQPHLMDWIKQTAGPLPLIIADPPYGNIVDEHWDLVKEDDIEFAKWMVSWTKSCEQLSCSGAALYVWGGIGKPGFRPFYRYLPEVEKQTGYQLSTQITWSKKRAYGIKWGFLFTREEIGYFVLGDIRKPRLFNVPLLDKKRGYAGYAQDVVVGYVSACYHIPHETCSCVSPGAQTQGKRDVLRLLRQMDLSQASEGQGAEAQDLGVQEQGALARVQSVEAGVGESEESSETFVVGVEGRRKETRPGLRVDRGGSKSSVDRSLPCIRDAHPGQRGFSEGRLSVGKSDRQLCWVCTREHLHHLLAGELAEKRRDDCGVGSPCGVHAPDAVFEDLAVTEKRMKYPAKSEFLRRTNVWTDITEILRGKVHIAQKPDRLHEIMIETHTVPGEWVLDTFAGSGTTGRAARKLGRKFILIENDPIEFDKCLKLLSS